ncbi:hypothetical protein OG196_14435 [Kitasatospora purpeofusca]|uniref:hypothetical protein n=1 Tax=Kitasatospora purpeofusca TaxID=67352 RepID=UPI002E103615|nr:hypothetical protein OG196_14435 [Kitasatospora purpeofusca]
MAVCLCYAAFVELHCGHYEMYARARLGDAGLAEWVVALVLCRTEADWERALREGPAAFTWRALCDAVTVARTFAPAAPPDSLHRVMPDQTADAALLHDGLGLAPAVAAALMGLDEPAVRVQLKAAYRWRGGRSGAGGA